jgi:pimeloyl-ACP methyl ester carboxylesterase
MSTTRLADGRTLAYEEWGDPAGTPILFTHGFGDSRLTRHPDDSIAERLGVRLITVDRPGIGGSDPKRVKAVAERADDLRELAGALGIERFAVLGWSGGTPTALACGARFPERVAAVGVAAGFAPFEREGAYEGLNARMARGLPGIRKAPWLARLFMAQAARGYRRDPEKAFEQQFGEQMTAPDRAVMAEPGVRDNMLAGAVEAHRQGSKGMALDMQLLFARQWGFDLADVRVPVRLWFGDADDLTPPQMGRYLAERLPDAELTMYPGEAHMLVLTHWQEILQSLAASVGGPERKNIRYA